LCEVSLSDRSVRGDNDNDGNLLSLATLVVLILSTALLHNSLGF